MRIGYLSSSTLPSRAANGVHVMRMCAALAQAGHDVTLYARRGGATPDEVFAHYGAPRTFRLALLDPRPFAYLAALRRALRARPRADLLYARHLPSAAFAAPAGARLVLELHGPPGSRASDVALRLLSRRRALDAVVTISHASRARLVESYPRLASRRLLVAPDGADLPPTPPGDPPAHFTAGYAGSLWPGRGVETILGAAAKLPDVPFSIWGGDPAQVEQRRAQAPKNVAFHGHVPPAHVQARLESASVLLAPYGRRVAVHGGVGDTSAWMSPLKIFEYMAARRPIVASDLPALREVLEHETNALLAPPDDADAWADAIDRLRRDPALARRIAERAYDDLASRFTWSRRAAGILAQIDAR